MIDIKILILCIIIVLGLYFLYKYYTNDENNVVSEPQYDIDELGENNNFEDNQLEDEHINQQFEDNQMNNSNYELNEIDNENKTLLKKQFEDNQIVYRRQKNN